MHSPDRNLPREAQLRRYQDHLNRVSRSFAFAIEQLDEDLREPVALSYLICRVLDTIEDAQWGSQDDQFAAFKQFRQFLNAPPSSPAALEWVKKFPSSLSDGERRLIDDAEVVFDGFKSLAVRDQNIIRAAVLSMANGMEHFVRRSHEEGALRLRNLPDINRYCFFVAGVVGEILTQLVTARAEWQEFSPTSQPTSQLMHGVRFGLSLQKINLLKDHAIDTQQGRFFIASRAELLCSLQRDCALAMEYIETIPIGIRGYRLFCAWALFLGLASLPAINRANDQGEAGKIARFEAMQLFFKVQLIIDDRVAMRRLFDELMRNGFADVSSVAMQGEDVRMLEQKSDWDGAEEQQLLQAYVGSLGASEVLAVFRV